MAGGIPVNPTLRPALEWIQDQKTRFLKCHHSDLQRVQSNAFKAGMAHAADMARDKGMKTTPSAVRQAILHAAQEWEIPADDGLTK